MERIDPTYDAANMTTAELDATYEEAMRQLKRKNFLIMGVFSGEYDHLTVAELKKLADEKMDE